MQKVKKKTSSHIQVSCVLLKNQRRSRSTKNTSKVQFHSESKKQHFEAFTPTWCLPHAASDLMIEAKERRKSPALWLPQAKNFMSRTIRHKDKLCPRVSPSHLAHRLAPALPRQPMTWTRCIVACECAVLSGSLVKFGFSKNLNVMAFMQFRHFFAVEQFVRNRSFFNS